MLKWIARHRVRSHIKAENAKRSRAFKNWDQIQKVALILCNSEDINKSNVDQFLEHSKKYVEVFFIELNSKEASFSDWTCFTRKEKNKFGLPQANITRLLSGKKYDLVIDVATGYELFSAALSACLLAPLKCGDSNSFEQNDLIIHRGENQNLVNYLDEIIRYLKMIRN